MLTIFANQRVLKRWSGSANGMAITAIISPEKIQKQNKLPSCTNDHANTSCTLSTLFFNISQIYARTWKRKEIRIWIKNFTTRQIVNEIFFRLVWFWIKNFATCQILNWIFFRLVRIWNQFLSKNQILIEKNLRHQIFTWIFFWKIIIPGKVYV